MTGVSTLRKAGEAHDSFGAGYLQRRLDREFPLAPHIGVSVIRANDEAVTLRAPFAPNSNYKGTAFGGSLYCVALLAGWAWATRYMESRGLNADAVIQESTIRYLRPVTGEFQASIEAPAPEQLGKFLKMLARSGKGRIRLTVEIRDGQLPAAAFEGVFVATTRL